MKPFVVLCVLALCAGAIADIGLDLQHLNGYNYEPPPNPMYLPPEEKLKIVDSFECPPPQAPPPCPAPPAPKPCPACPPPPPPVVCPKPPPPPPAPVCECPAPNKEYLPPPTEYLPPSKRLKKL